MLVADVMGFGGSVPEIANGRLAMLGFVAAVGAEFASGGWMGCQQHRNADAECIHDNATIR